MVEFKTEMHRDKVIQYQPADNTVESWECGDGGQPDTVFRKEDINWLGLITPVVAVFRIVTVCRNRTDGG